MYVCVALLLGFNNAVHKFIYTNMKYFSESGKVIVEVYFAADDVVRFDDCKCGDAFDVLKAFVGYRMRDGAFLKDNKGILSRDKMLSEACGNIWIVNGGKRLPSLLTRLFGTILCHRPQSDHCPELKSGFPRNWFARRPPQSVVPDSALEMRLPYLA